MPPRNPSHPPRPRFRSALRNDRDFRARRDRFYKAQMTEVSPGIFSFGKALTTKDPKPRHLDRWGRWEWDARRLVLVFRSPWRHWTYEVDPERMHTSAQALDAIFQVAGKHERIVSSADIGDLVRTLDDLISPQTHLCSFGINKQFDPTGYLARRVCSQRGGHRHGR